MMKKRTMNSQRRPDSTRQGDTLEPGRPTRLTAEEIFQRLADVDVVYKDNNGQWQAIPGESAFFEVGLEPDECMTPEFRRELDKIEAAGVDVIVNTAEECAQDSVGPSCDLGMNN